MNFPGRVSREWEVRCDIGRMAGRMLGNWVLFSMPVTLARFINLYLNVNPLSYDLYILVLVLSIKAKQKETFFSLKLLALD